LQYCIALFQGDKDYSISSTQRHTIGDYSNRALRRKRSFSQTKHLFLPNRWSIWQEQTVCLPSTNHVFHLNIPSFRVKLTFFFVIRLHLMPERV